MEKERKKGCGFQTLHSSVFLSVFLSVSLQQQKKKNVLFLHSAKCKIGPMTNCTIHHMMMMIMLMNLQTGAYGGGEKMKEIQGYVASRSCAV
jgi:hypothetical protein